MKKKILAVFALFLCGLTYSHAQSSSTPNIGLQIPATGSNNWYIPLNYNFTKLDLLLSGNSPLPNLTVTGTGSFGGVVTAAGFAGPGGSGTALTTGAAQYSPAYFSSPGTAFVINGVTPFNGAAYYSTSAAPRAWLSSDIASLLVANASGCNTASTFYSPVSNTCAVGGGGSAANPANCTTSTTTSICIVDTIYNGSAYGATTTTAASITSGSSSTTVASCATFLAGNGVLIPGAGTTGANFIAPLVSCTGTTMTWTGTTATTVSSVTIQHDETTAINAAITELGTTNGGGDVWFSTLPTGSAGLYLVNGPLQSTGTINAVLPLPTIANYAPNIVRIGLKGLQAISTNGLSMQSGAILQTSVNSGNFIAGYDTAFGGGFPPFTNVWLDTENLTYVGPDNPGIVMVNCTNCMSMTAKHLLIETNGGTFPTNTAGGGIYYPGLGNNVRISVDDIAEGGFYTGYVIGEHSQSSHIVAANSYNCFVFDAGANAGAGTVYRGNSASVDYLWAQFCPNEIAAGANPTTINVQNADLEQVTNYGVNDPNGLLRGQIDFYVPQPAYGTSFCNANPNGAQNLLLVPLYCLASSPVAVSTEYWKSQEGSGSTLLNSGTDSTNTMTATNLAWATADGFQSTVATYNGATAYSVASSAAGTSFTNTQPFTACAFFTASNSSESSFILSNLQTGISAAPGFRIGLLSGHADVYLISNASTSNLIHGLTPDIVANGGVPHHICITYTGSSLASGLTLYIDGTQHSYTVATDALTGSTASTTPLYIGSEADFSQFFAGAIGGVQVWPEALSAASIETIYAYGSTGIPSVPPYTSTITLTTATSDFMIIPGVTASSKCSFVPVNSTAAGIASTLNGYYTTSANTFTLNHAATIAAGATYSVICSKF